MGSSGAASGIDPYVGRNHKLTTYGSEFTTLHIAGDVKFVTTTTDNVRTPMETRTPGRIYATISRSGEIAAITTYDSNGVKAVQIDLLQPHRGLSPHAHDGSNHAEGRELTQQESLLVKYIQNEWTKHKQGGK